MSENPRLTLTVIGAGTIGLGWTTLFLARGHHVRVNSRRPEVEQIVREALALQAPGLPEHGVDSEELASRLTIEPDIERAVDGVDVVQENTPENLALKQELLARIGKVADPRTLLLSSTSTLLPDDLGAEMDDPGNVVVGHPFNPPHVVPLVEVLGGDRTNPDAVDRTVEFYRSLGKVPIVLRKPMAAFVANRLQSALLQESIHLVREGVVTVDELDAIVTNSIGLRWATIGPFRAFHLGGGQGGLRKWLTTLGAGLERGWRGLGQPPMNDETLELLLSQAETAFGDRTFEDLSAERDAKQKAVLGALADADKRDS
ncbi:MAG: 3-hydroxyacyl-CoA dehydrogenase NAD-binding domain-containing protein [Actinomycetota bacterium]|nr:3-hydroxyacyl-CoA dehydrogenase NAD-binding domain-containing protein [Actinomycetota bacterium]